MTAAKATISHERIREWVEARGGHPAHVKGTGKNGDVGILRIDFPGYSGQQTLEEIDWDTFFDAFEANELAFLHQADENSRFNKLVRRSSVELDEDELRQVGERAEREGTNAIRLLEHQHREVEALFQRFEDATSVTKKESIFDELADALAAHSKIEEELFYPQVYTDEASEILEESVEEHLEVKRLLADLMDLPVDDPSFGEKMIELQEMVEGHVEKEEERLFEMVTQADVVNLDELGEEMEELYDSIITEEPRLTVPEEIDRPAPL